jgi:hypothetical protein
MRAAAIDSLVVVAGVPAKNFAGKGRFDVS